MGVERKNFQLVLCEKKLCIWKVKVGNYRGETAAALGVAHYTAEDTMFHVGVSVGSHHNMVNAGVTRKFGTSDKRKAIPERYKGGPIRSMYVMQDELTQLKAENALMK